MRKMADDSITTIKLSGFEKKFFRDLNDLRLQNLFCDVRFNVNETIVPCHRLVLATMSPYFKTMFNGNFKESTSDCITINDIETEAFEEILNAIYTASIRFSPNNAFFILKASHLLQLEMIECSCATYIMNNPKINYLVDACVFAKNINHRDLYFTCRITLLNNFIQYGKTDSFKRIPYDVLEYILSYNEFLEVEEESVVLLIMKWAKENAASRAAVQNLLRSANLKVTKFLNSSLITELLVTCDDHEIEDGGDSETCQDSDQMNSSLPLELYFDSIDVKTGQLGWNILKTNEEMNRFAVSSFYPTDSCFKKVCKVGSKLYCFEYFVYKGKRNVFSCYDEHDNRVILPTPDSKISKFEMYAKDNSLYLVAKKLYFTIWIYDIEQNKWQNMLKKNDHEKIYNNVSACTFSDGVFYIIADRCLSPYQSDICAGKYIFSITCLSQSVTRLTKVPYHGYEYKSILVCNSKIIVLGSWVCDEFNDTFFIFDNDSKQWAKDLKIMSNRRKNYNLFHFKEFMYVVESGRAMLPNEKYDLTLNKWIDLPTLPQRFTLAGSSDVVATGQVFGFEVNLR